MTNARLGQEAKATQTDSRYQNNGYAKSEIKYGIGIQSERARERDEDRLFVYKINSITDSKLLRKLLIND